MVSTLTVGLASTGLWCCVQFMRMVYQGKRLKADRWRLIGSSVLLRILLPDWIDIPGIMLGIGRSIAARHSDFQRVGKDGYVEVSMASSYKCVVFIADPHAFKEITRPRSPFVRDMGAMSLIRIFGDNLLTVEGDEWKHHRRIAQRAFTEKTPRLVWAETSTALEQLFEIWDHNHGDKVCVPDTLDLTKNLTLMIISAAALGHRNTWKEDSEPWPGFQFSFQKALSIVSHSVILGATLPKWVQGLTKTTRDIRTAHIEFDRYLRQMIEDHRQKGDSSREASKIEPASTRATDNVFDVLVAASHEDAIAEGKGLLDSDVVGNAFLFLFAGHETTASAIAFALGLLALYPDIQQEVYTQISQVLGSRASLEYADIGSLPLVHGAFLETLRIYPSAPQLLRITNEDTNLTVARNNQGPDGTDRETIFVPAGSYVLANIAAIHFNPKYWPEPEKFQPSRFVGTYNRDAFLPFSNGGKVCIGQKFAETEGVAALACILARYEISVDSSLFPDVPGESSQDRQTRLLDPKSLMSVVPRRRVPLVFTRRV